MRELSRRSGLEEIIFRNLDGDLKEEAIRDQLEINKLAGLLELTDRNPERVVIR